MEGIPTNYDLGQTKFVPEDQRHNKRERYYLQYTIHLDRDEVYHSRFDLNNEHGNIEIPFKLVLRTATPIFDREGRKAAVLRTGVRVQRGTGTRRWRSGIGSGIHPQSLHLPTGKSGSGWIPWDRGLLFTIADDRGLSARPRSGAHGDL